MDDTGRTDRNGAFDKKRALTAPFTWRQLLRRTTNIA